MAVVRVLAALHERWTGVAEARWPWLRPPAAAVHLVAELYDRKWPELARRSDWWLLTSEPEDWDAALDAASPTDRAAVPSVLPAALTQALLQPDLHR